VTVKKRRFNVQPTYGNRAFREISRAAAIGKAGTFHTEAMHVTERYTRVDYNRINYDVTVEDPNVPTKPWITHSLIILRPGTRLRQYECAENNSDIQHYRPTPHGPGSNLASFRVRPWPGMVVEMLRVFPR